MKATNKFLKKILSTTSALTLVLGIANDAAAAATHTVTTDNVYLQGTGQTSNGGGLGGTIINSGDTFAFTTAANIYFTLGTIAGGFDLGGQDFSAKVIQIQSGASTMGSISNAAASTYIPLSIQDGASLTLNGAAADGTVGTNNYSALGAVTIGSSTGGASGTSTISATGAVTFTNTFDSYSGATANWGTLNVSGANHIFSGVLGGAYAGSHLGAINITDTSNITFSNNVTATSFQLASGSTLTISSSSGLSGSANQITGTIDGSSSGYGTLAVTLAGARNSSYTHFNSNIGSNEPLSSISFGINTSIYLNSVSMTANSFYAGSGSSVYNMGTTTINGNATLDASTFNVTLQGGSLATSGNLSVIGTLEIDNGITLTSNGTSGITLTGSTTFYHWGGAAPVITSGNGININGYTLTAEGAQTISGSLLTTGNAGTGGTFVINAGDVTLVGSVGTSANSISALNFTSNNTLTISGTQDIYSYITTSADGQGTLKLSGGTTTLHYNVGNYTGSTLNHALAGININDQTLVINSGIGNFFVGGNISTTTPGSGTLTTTGAHSVTFYNDIGDGAALGTFNVNANTILLSGAVAVNTTNIGTGTTLTVDSSAGTRGITGAIGLGYNSSVLTLTGSNTISITGNITNTNATAGYGTVNINAPVTLVGSIGTSLATSLASVDFLSTTTNYTLSVSGTQSIFAPVTTAGNNYGSINLSATNTALTMYNNIGGTNFVLTGMNIANTGQTLTINSTNGAIAVYAPITSYSNGVGTLTTTGSHSVTFNNNIGAYNSHALAAINIGAPTTLYSSTVAATAINLGSGQTLTIDSTGGASSTTGTIDGNGGAYGILKLQGSNNMDIYSQVGPTYGVSGITVSNTGGTTTFHNNVSATGNIDASAAASPVNFAGTVSTTGNFLTSLSSYSAMTGNVSASSVTLSNNASFAGGITAPSGIILGYNTLTATGGIIAANITGNSGGVLNISANPVTLKGNVGGVGAAISAVNFATNTTLAISGGSSIYAPITATNIGGSGLLTVAGGNVAINNHIGTSSNPIGTVKVLDNSSLTVNGNIYATYLLLNNTGSQLSLSGGTSGTSNLVSPNIYSTNNQTTGGTGGQGIVNVGTGSAASYINFMGSLGPTSATAIQLLNVVGSATSANASNATISAVFNYFKTGQSGSSGIIVGQNSTVTVASGAALYFSGSAAITAAVAGSGTLFMNNVSTVPCAVGTTDTPLGKVQLGDFNSGIPVVLGNAVNATTLDLISSSVIILDAHATGITNFTNSAGEGELDFTTASSTLSIGNVGLPLYLYATNNALTIAGSTAPAPATFVGAGSTLIAANGASVYNVLSLGGTYGTLTNAGNATFTGAIGGSGHSLVALNLSGTGVETINFTTATDIYAVTISHNALTLDASANNINMHSTSYTMSNATLNAGTRTMTVTGGSATLTGTITINATYAASGQVALNLSSANSVLDTGITALTFNVTNANGITPVAGSTIIMIKGLSQNVIAGTLGMSTDTKWAISGGVLTYTIPVAPVAAVSSPSTVTITAPDLPSIGATGNDINTAAPILASSGLNVNSDGSLPVQTSSTGQSTLVIPEAIVSTISTQSSSVQLGTLDSIAQTINKNLTLTLDQTTVNTVANAASSLGFIPDEIANSLRNLERDLYTSSTITELILFNKSEIQNLTSAATTTSQSSLNEAANIVATRVAFIQTISPINAGISSFPPTASAAPTVQPEVATQVIGAILPPPAQVVAEEENEIPENNLEASAYGIAAGDSPYDKFGVWGSVNFGKAQQKLRKGNPGFHSTSKGVSIGVDTLINEQIIIGFNIANSFSDVKYKGTARGNKTEVSSWIGSLYGNYQFHENWFVRGTALFNQTHINNKSLRPIVINTQPGFGIAQAKYNMISYGGDAVIGTTYRFKNDVILTPTIGMRLLHNNKISYKETGSTAFNNSSKQRALNSLSGLLGASVARTFVTHGINLTPEAHFNTQYGINSKGPKGSFVSPINPNSTTNFVGTAPSKLTTTYGVSLTGSNDRLECVLSGDMSISSKYVGYQGAVKLKIKF